MKIKYLLFLLANCAAMATYSDPAQKAPLKFAALSAVCAESTPDNINACQASRGKLQEVAKQLETTLHRPISLEIYSQISDAKDLLKQHKADLIYMKLVPYLQLQQDYEAHCFQAIASSAQEGKTEYHAVFVTLSPKHFELADLKNHHIGFIKDSASGYMLPLERLKEANITDQQYFTIYNSYYDAVKALKAGQIEGVFAADAPFQQGAFGDPKLFHFSIILQPALPTAIVVADRCDMSESEIAAAQKALFSIKINYTHTEGINSFTSFKPLTKTMLQTLED